MSKALPEHIYPFRLAHHRESLSGSMVDTDMPRLAEMLDGGVSRANFELRFDHDDGGQPCVLGRIDAKLVALCQRCLQPMELDIEREVRVALVRGDAEAAALDATYDPMLIGDEPISLSEFLEDELILAMPNFSRHRPGECVMPPGADTSYDTGESGNSQDAEAAGESGEDNPFSVLESLKPRTTP